MTTVRLDTHTLAILDRLAEQRGQTRSEVIRDAISYLAESAEEPSAYERLRPFLSVANSGGAQLSEQTGKSFREMLDEKHRVQRSR